MCICICVNIHMYLSIPLMGSGRAAVQTDIAHLPSLSPTHTGVVTCVLGLSPELSREGKPSHPLPVVKLNC